MSSAESAAASAASIVVGFASDNYSGVHPRILEAIESANTGDALPYGEDVWTARLQDELGDALEHPVDALPVLTGTGANIVALRAIAPAWGSVVVPATSHELTDESGAPEHALGLKLLPIPTPDGKLRPADIDSAAEVIGDVHSAQPSAVSIANVTEVGTVYDAAEIAALAETAHRHGLRLHVDGTRLWGAAAALGSSLADLSSTAGVDILSLGGTKTGALAAEAVVVLDPELREGVPYIRKQLAQLASKSRFLAAQMLALLEDDLGLDLARHGHAMARRLLTALGSDGSASTRSGELRLGYDAQASSLFPILPDAVAARLRKRYRFYDWRVLDGERMVRWMTSWATTPEEVDAFAEAIRAAIAADAH